jgi:hypothetical protein
MRTITSRGLALTATIAALLVLIFATGASAQVCCERYNCSEVGCFYECATFFTGCLGASSIYLNSICGPTTSQGTRCRPGTLALGPFPLCCQLPGGCTSNPGDCLLSGALIVGGCGSNGDCNALP